jgi:Fatty acid hydroxylase superfamily
MLRPIIRGSRHVLACVFQRCAAAFGAPSRIKTNTIFASPFGRQENLTGTPGVQFVVLIFSSNQNRSRARRYLGILYIDPMPVIERDRALREIDSRISAPTQSGGKSVGVSAEDSKRCSTSWLGESRRTPPRLPSLAFPVHCRRRSRRDRLVLARPEAAVSVEMFASIGVSIMRVPVKGMTSPPVLPVAFFLYSHRVATVPLNTAWGLGLLLLAEEFAYYWMHRAGHEVRWLWASHVVHHTPEHIHFASAFRIGATEFFSRTWLFFLPLSWLGFNPLAVTGMLAINLFYQFWLHTDLIGRLGPLEGFSTRLRITVCIMPRIPNTSIGTTVAF